MELEELKQQAKDLKYKAHTASNTEDKIIFSKEYHKKSLELIDKIHEKDKSKNLGMSVRNYLKYVDNLPNNPKYATGIDKIDDYFNGGFEGGMFINLAGSSFAGKTTLALNIIANIAESRKTAWFNFEMGDRLMAKKLRGLVLTENQIDNMYIENVSNNIDDLINEMEMKVEDGYRFFGVDSSMKIDGGKGAQEYMRLGDISNRLSKFCARKDATVIFINQMSEESIDAKKLKFKGSGNVMYDSDIALFLIVKDDDNVPMDKRVRTLICNKNRQSEKLFSVDIFEHDYKSAGVREITIDDPLIIDDNNIEIPIFL